MSNPIIEEKIMVVDNAIDREKTCPLLLRVFTSLTRPHTMNDYAKGVVPSKELQIYTWMDATLTELSNLVKDIHREARKKGTTFVFRTVFPDPKSPDYRLVEIGSLTVGEKGPEDMKALRQIKFTIGDYMDIHIITPQARAGDRDRRDRDRAPREGWNNRDNRDRRY